MDENKIRSELAKQLRADHPKMKSENIIKKNR